jgi:hypothetical protein
VHTHNITRLKSNTGFCPSAVCDLLSFLTSLFLRILFVCFVVVVVVVFEELAL